MIVRNDITADTYCPLPFSSADYRRLKKDFRAHAPDVELDRGYTDDGKPYVSVTVPGVGFDDAPPCIIIIRSERGWQMHRGGEGPLYEFATEREVAEFLGSGGLTVRPLGMMRAGARSPGTAAPATTLRAAEQGRYGRRR